MLFIYLKINGINKNRNKKLFDKKILNSLIFIRTRNNYFKFQKHKNYRNQNQNL